MSAQTQINLPEFSRGFHIITSIIEENIELPEAGILHVFIKHTSAGLTINENADFTVREDFESSFNHIIKERAPIIKKSILGDPKTKVSEKESETIHK